MSDGCGVCEWNGGVTVTHDRTHEYYTHVTVIEGEIFKGRTCSRRTTPQEKGLIGRLAEAMSR